MSCIIRRRWSHIKRFLQGNQSAFFTPKSSYSTENEIEPFVSGESNPAHHTTKEIGFFYKIDNSLSWDCLFKPLTVLEPPFYEESITFGATYIMIRKPALEIIHYLKHANYNNPINKYVLYGKYGSGVTTTMMHVLHYGHLNGWCLVHVPSIITWLTEKTERSESTTREGLTDLPIMGSAWLSHFKNQNFKILRELDLKLQNDYTWNIQEENKKGESLLSLVDHGIARGKYSCDVIIALMQELKELSKSGKIRVLVAIESFSTFFRPEVWTTPKKVKQLNPDQLSFTEAFKSMATPDWHNGAAVLSCLALENTRDDVDHLPLNRLTPRGFEFLDPFVPVEVPRLTDGEETSLLNFYKSQKWISMDGVDEELKILATGNIRTLKRLCAPL